jgi:hypothetical protein
MKLKFTKNMAQSDVFIWYKSKIGLRTTLIVFFIFDFIHKLIEIGNKLKAKRQRSIKHISFEPIICESICWSTSLSKKQKK